MERDSPQQLTFKYFLLHFRIMRTLYWVPHLHLPQEAPKVIMKNYKHRKDRAYTDFVTNYMSQISQRVAQIKIHRLYPEGWYGETLEEFYERSRDFSAPTSNFLLSLIKNGAVLERTENRNLLKETVSNVVELHEFAPKGQISWEDFVEKGTKNNIRRDLFIRSRISGTLREGENGLLMIGLGHIILDYGDIDIIEVYPRKQLYQELVAAVPRLKYSIDEDRREEEVIKKWIREGYIDYLDNQILNLERF